MSKVRNEIAVGVLFFVALSILGYFTIVMKEDLFESKTYYYMTVVFPDIEGLGKSDRVKINGVDSGIVEEVRLLESNDVLVKIKMYNRFNLYESYKIKIKNETALGGKYISIDPGIRFEDGIHYAAVEDYDNLKGYSSGDLFGSITDLIAENRENIYRSIRNLRDITSKINKGKGTIGKLVNENKVHDDADNLITEVRDTIEDSREQAPITSFIRAALMAF
ncbi:MAG: MCE family protein [Spirochaetes bacterium]|nr:MCE family protein [Spirochaetota bacterium]